MHPSSDNWDSRTDFLSAAPDDIWHPDTRLINALDYNWDELCDNVDANVYDSSGATTVMTNHGALKYNVFWSRPCVLKAKCEIKLEWFPFDTNVCPLQFEPWADNFLNMVIATDSTESSISI